jgi:signal transduction histidine kinase
MTNTLQQKNTEHLFGRLLILILAGSFFFYFLMRMQASHMQKKQLELSQFNLWEAFRQKHGIIPIHIKGEYDIIAVNDSTKEGLNVLKDTSLYYADQNQWYSFAKLTKEYASSDGYYRITTYVSSTEINHLIIKVFITGALILALLFIAVIYINRKTSALLWLPFRSTMKKLSDYDINRNLPVDLPVETGIAEFNELNAVAVNLIAKTNQAYHNQKQFVENASHEIQTPLAIIRTKLELLIDQPDITEEIAGLLADITDANERLSQMNKNLLLLAKIENNQFPSKGPINLSSLINHVIQTYQQYYEDKFPSVIKSIQQDLTVIANPSLMEILISNLIKNAVIHNIPSGHIRIELDNNCLRILNTGAPLETDTEQLFERFKKGSDEIRSTGLGLSLVKQICQLYDFKIDYSYDNGIHAITVFF